MVRIDSGLLKAMGEVSSRFDIVGIEFGDVAMCGMPSRVLIFPSYGIVHADNNADNGRLEPQTRI